MCLIVDRPLYRELVKAAIGRTHHELQAKNDTCKGEGHPDRQGTGRSRSASATQSGNLAASEAIGRRLAEVSVGAAIAVGAVLGLVIGIVVSVATDVPLAPEAGLVLGALVGWLLRRKQP
jgi:hypothetical protein